MSKPFRSTVPAAIVAAAACALGLAQAPQESGATLRERIERLRGEGEAAEAEMASLPQLGEEAALAALDGLSSAGPLERRRRAHLVFLAGGGRAIEPAIAALGDPDPVTRGELLAFLGRDDLGASGLDARVAALADRALADPDRSLRAGAIERLAALDRPESLARLDSILDGIEAGLRARAAALLADRPLAREAVERRVRAGRASGPEVLGPMLLAYGRILAERGDFASAAPILAAREDPDPTVRRGARLGIDELMRRTMSGGDAARAAAAVRELAQ